MDLFLLIGIIEPGLGLGPTLSQSKKAETFVVRRPLEIWPCLDDLAYDDEKQKNTIRGGCTVHAYVLQVCQVIHKIPSSSLVWSANLLFE